MDTKPTSRVAASAALRLSDVPECPISIHAMPRVSFKVGQVVSASDDLHELSLCEWGTLEILSHSSDSSVLQRIGLCVCGKSKETRGAKC